MDDRPMSKENTCLYWSSGMNHVFGLIKRIPGAKPAYREVIRRFDAYKSNYRALMRRFNEYKLSRKTTEQVFTEIFKSNGWGGTESLSGRGSTIEQTQVLIRALPELCRAHGVRSVLDIPCGDYHWMRQVDLSGIDYTGADIVADLVERNTASFGREGVNFHRMDLIRDPLPQVDLIVCRDCLVHLSFKDIFAALDRAVGSGSQYLLTTTFPDRKDNADIVTGSWRPLNLELPPFCLPPPILVINEQCTEGDGQFADKSMALWRLADIKICLDRRIEQSLTNSHL